MRDPSCFSLFPCPCNNCQHTKGSVHVAKEIKEQEKARKLGKKLPYNLSALVGGMVHTASELHPTSRFFFMQRIGGSVPYHSWSDRQHVTPIRPYKACSLVCLEPERRPLAALCDQTGPHQAGDGSPTWHQLQDHSHCLLKDVEKKKRGLAVFRSKKP